MSDVSLVSDVPANDTPTQPETVAVVKRGRGRPQVYAGVVRLYIIGLISLLGLTKTRKVLNNAGAVRKAACKKFSLDYDGLMLVIPHKLNISMLKLFQLGREGGLTLTRGRPKTKVAVAPVVAETKQDAAADAAAQVASAPVAG